MSTSQTRPAATLIERLGGLHDPLRLRLLILLESHELSVGELAATVQSPQSTVSRHLKRLLETGWILRRSVGPQALYRHAGEDVDSEGQGLWRAASAGLDADPASAEDLRRVQEILAQRHVDSRTYFGSLGGDWTDVRDRLFGDAAAWAWMPALIDQDAVVADLGCGTGQMAAILAPWVARIEAVDREPAMLDAARTRLADYDNIRFHLADMTRSPLAGQHVDLAIFGLVLHHVEDPSTAISNAAECIRPGGRIFVLDMIRHDRDEYRDTMGHVHLGFDQKQLAGWFAEAGLQSCHWQPLRPDPNAAGPGLFVATAKRPVV